MIEGVTHLHYLIKSRVNEFRHDPYEDLSHSIPFFYDANDNLIAVSKTEYVNYVKAKRYGLQWADRADMARALRTLHRVIKMGIKPTIKTKHVKGSLIK